MKNNKKVKLCQYCQVEISKRSKLCPNCKKKQKNSIIQLFWIVTGSIFVLLCTKQPYVIALMFVMFIIKTIMLANVNKSVVKNNKCER